MSDKSTKRRAFSLVNKEMYYRYVGLMVLTVLVISIITGAFIFMSNFDTINILKQLAAGNQPLIYSLETIQISNLLRFSMSAVLILIAIAIVGVIEISRIAGPLYRISQVAKSIADGDYPISFQIRTKDMPKGLEDSFNRMVVSLREKTKKDAEALDAVCSNLKKISAQHQDGRTDSNSVRSIEEAISTLAGISSQKKKSIQSQV